MHLNFKNCRAKQKDILIYKYIAKDYVWYFVKKDWNNMAFILYW